MAQCAIGTDVTENLETCLRMLREAESCAPDLVVLPEFCNHLSWYSDQQHCYTVSLDLDGPFLAAIAKQARVMNSMVALNCTLRLSNPGQTEKECTGTSLLFGANGVLLGRSDKQVLIGHENDFLRPAVEAGPIIETAWGSLGLYACMDGVINETPRCLALRGAQLLCNSLNSFATDEGSLHIPVRAAENKVFVAAANKIGPLIPAELMQTVSEQTGIPLQFLSGAGESQIVAPDGTVLAKASLDDEDIVWADIDLSEATSKVRPDGGDLIAQRRPELYAALGVDPRTQPIAAVNRSEQSLAGLVQLTVTGPDAFYELSEQLSIAFSSGASVVVVPPLFFLPGQQLGDPFSAAADSVAAVDFLASLCASDHYVATSLVLEDPLQLCGVLIGSEGIVLRQGQLHPSARYRFSSLAESVVVCDAGYSKLAVLTSDDACIPESFRLAALAGADTICVPGQPQESWEVPLGLLERSAENRVNLLAAMQPGPLGRSLATCLTRDFTVMTPWAERPFDGLLSQPPYLVAENAPGLTLARFNPACADNKVVSLGTDLLAGRPWQLLQPICASQEAHNVYE